ncbi:Hypothetical_protein [Hexamita inflata]|uniref:Hypothetical_protein n=1 Tax=Hexamita inflata TaxID=28002 RepID=A0ABP1K3Q3_9EUKA
MRLGQIGCGRQNPPFHSASQGIIKERYGQGHAINEPLGLESSNRSIASLETQMVGRRWIPYRSARTKQPRYAPGCLYPSRWLPWLRRCASRTQVCLKLMIIRVNLQFLYRRPNQYKRKLSEWDIYIYRQVIQRQRQLTQNRTPSQSQRKPRRRSSKWNIQKYTEIVYLTIESQERYQSSQTLGNRQSTTGNIPRNQKFAKSNKLRRTPGTQSSQ